METTSMVSESEPRSGGDSASKKAAEVKRVLACGTCRKRKLKCDGRRPKCSTCDRLGHPCEYDEVRKKSGPKRGYVKSLEARLNQLESLLDGGKESAQGTMPATEVPRNGQPKQIPAAQQPLPTFAPRPPPKSPTKEINPDEIFPQVTMTDQDLGLLADFGGITVGGFSWDMVSLGLEEPLPSQDVMDELYQIYFDKVHPSVPMLNRARFMASLSLAPNSRPPVCLRYIVFAHACSVSHQYHPSAEQFYQKARKYVEQDEMRGHGEQFVSVAHAQCWNLISVYEFKYMYFPRAWLSVARGGRLCQCLGLHRQDHVGIDVKQTLGPPQDWAELEERRRTFWMAYCHDRYASIGTGWPMMFHEDDIMTNLPATDQAYATGVPERTSRLADVIAGDQTAGLSPLASVILMATLFGRNLVHLHRPSTDDNDSDLNGEFWRRHRSLDNILLNILLTLPAHLRLPQGINDPNIVFCNMEIHTSVICLHQAAIFKTDKHKLAGQISSESKRRCLVAADQITSLMKMISHQDLSGLSPFIAFSLYVAARVFVQYLKFKKSDLTVKSSLMFLLSAMHALKVRNPLTESFLIQLDVDLEGSGIEIPPSFATGKMGSQLMAESTTDCKLSSCSPMVEIREVPPTQTKMRPDNTTFYQSQMRLGSPDFDTNNLFGGQNFDNGSLQGHGRILNSGLTPSSSNSNQPTPAGSSSVRRTSSSATSPPSDAKNTCASSMSMSTAAHEHPFMLNTKITNGDGMMPAQFDMRIGTGDSPLNLANKSSAGLRNKNFQPEIGTNTLKTMPYNMNMESDHTGPTQPVHQPTHDPMMFELNMESTGLTPLPLSTGFTPGPTGMTPGNFGTASMGDWPQMHVAEGNEWMFDQ